MSIAEGRPPALSNTALVKLITKFYSFDSVDTDSIKHFPGYDDRNFYFRGVPCRTEKETEFVLKIFNQLHSSHEVVVGVSNLWTHLIKKGFTFSSYLRNTEGNAVTFVPKTQCHENDSLGTLDKEDTYAVRILHFVQGELLDDIDKRYLTPKLMHNVGKFVGRVDAALQDGFHDEAIRQRKNPDWDLMHLLHLRVHLPSIEDPSHRAIVQKALDSFESCVLPKIPTFPKGVIHGDANGLNLIVTKNEGDEYEIAGLIDFDDSVESCCVFDIAILLAYIMLANLKPIGYPSPVEFVSELLRGYLKEVPISKEEIDCLFYLVLGRCCQSAVLGEISYKAEPWNEYLLVTPKNAYKLMEMMLAMGKDRVDAIWAEACS